MPNNSNIRIDNFLVFMFFSFLVNINSSTK
jgi:hypothetical protein